DTMIAAGLISSQLFSFNLDDLAFSELGFRKIAITQLIGAKKDQPMSAVPIDKLSAYACEDALITWRLYQKYRPALEEPYLKKVYYEIEMPLVGVLAKMERVGVRLDGQRLVELGQKLHQRLSKLEKEVHDLAGQDFNLASPAQLKEILFEKLKLRSTGLRRTKTGLSLDAESLLKLRAAHPIVQLILEYRELSKLLNTYVDTLPEQTDAQGRLHTTFLQLGAATGRLASTKPNLMNIPVRTQLGNDVRRAFIAAPGYQLLGADYSQAELRVLAHFSDDPHLIEAFQRGGDFHASIGGMMKVDRRTAKAINFGIIYGQGPNSLADSLGISTAEAKQFIDRYFTAFPGVVSYINRVKEQARHLGYVETLFGRRRYLPDIHSPNPMLRAAAERMAVNMPSQGTVADMMKLAMSALDQALPQSARLIVQIHDELLLEVETALLERVAPLVTKVMSEIVSLKVGLEVEIKIGPNWADLK
ncbi:MAG: DNA polymerase, partial [Patescibacteria group bacterium]